MDLPAIIDKLDKALFILIHNDADHPVLDNIMLLIRNPYTWIPLYVFFLFYFIKIAGHRAWLIIIISIISFAITDSLSASLLKPLIGRTRPCFDPALQPFLRNILDCGGRYSFPSSHASNHFGLATFWFWVIYNQTSKKWYWLFIWAAVISYAQVYVGKHYPLDVAGGALLGYLVGVLCTKIYEFIFNNPRNAAAQLNTA
jgi:membrane-associated phospholipid phosphatase